MTPAELTAWLRQCAKEWSFEATHSRLLHAADLIERAYPPPNTPGERRMGFTDPEPLLYPPVATSPLMYLRPPPGHVRVRVAVQVTGEGAVTTTAIQGKIDDLDAMRMCRRKQEHDPTHQAIILADVPPCVPVPEVPAAVEEVAP